MRGVQNDLTGQTFGKLTVVCLGTKRGTRYFWKCRCECGRTVDVRNDNLGQDGRVDCGEHQVEAPNVDLTGKTFGRLTVIKLHDKDRLGNYRWWCRCSCGRELPVRGSSLKIGRARSCGCLQRDRAAEQAKKMGAANLRHGATGTPEWIAWHNIRQRCGNPNAKEYDNYGGRGIKVCDRWQGETGFENFLVDMGSRPSSRHSIDRFPDQNGDYCPENCRWATAKEQQRNRTNNVLLTYNGKEQCLAAWAEEFRLTRRQLWTRIKAGWPMHEALTIRPHRRNTRIGHKGKSSGSSG